MPRNRDNSNTPSETVQENPTNTTGEVENRPEAAEPAEPARVFVEPEPEEAEAEPVGPAQYVDDEGTQWVSFISTRLFIPGGDAMNITRIMVNAPIGYVEWFGSLTGWATGDEDKVNKLKDDKGAEYEKTSICLLGDFKAHHPDADGVMSTKRSRKLYLPQNYSSFMRDQLRSRSAADPAEKLDLDIEIGVARIKPIGSTIFEWRIRDFGADPAAARHKLIEARREARLARRAQRTMIGGGRRSDRVLDLPSKIVEPSGK